MKALKTFIIQSTDAVFIKARAAHEMKLFKRSNPINLCYNYHINNKKKEARLYLYQRAKFGTYPCHKYEPAPRILKPNGKYGYRPRTKPTVRRSGLKYKTRPKPDNKPVLKPKKRGKRSYSVDNIDDIINVFNHMNIDNPNGITNKMVDKDQFVNAIKSYAKCELGIDADVDISNIKLQVSVRNA